VTAITHPGEGLVQVPGAACILVRSYALCSELSVKAGDDPAARATADRAFTLASDLGDPVLLGVAARQSAITLRRAGHRP
jgi:hypothetical protein